MSYLNIRINPQKVKRFFYIKKEENITNYVEFLIL